MEKQPNTEVSTIEPAAYPMQSFQNGKRRVWVKNQLGRVLYYSQFHP